MYLKHEYFVDIRKKRKKESGANIPNVPNGRQLAYREYKKNTVHLKRLYAGWTICWAIITIIICIRVFFQL